LVRIVYLHQYFNTRSMVGGTRSYEMARRLVGMGHEVDIVTSSRTAAAPTLRRWSRTDEDGVRVHWLTVPYSNHMSYRRRLWAFARFAWASAPKAASLGGDVLFATSTPLTIALPAVYAAWRRGIPLVLEIRDLWPEVPIAMGALRRSPSIRASRWLERFAYRHAAHIIALSPGIRDGIVGTGYPADRVTVLPNGCDLELFDVKATAGLAVRREHRWLGNRPLVLYAGALGAVNGVCYLARVAAAAATIDPEVCFVTIGDGKEEGLVRTTAAQLGVLNRNFFMLASMQKRDIPAWLSAANIASSIVVDLRELWANSANKVFDAFAAGRPIAINHEGWLADLIRLTGTGLVLPPRDTSAAAAQLITAVRDPVWLAGAGAAAGQIARERFSRDELATQLERVLKTTVAAWRAGVTPAARPVREGSSA
jgi:glycosyltransferase involved in cell wall biosynthesis